MYQIANTFSNDLNHEIECVYSWEYEGFFEKYKLIGSSKIEYEYLVNKK